MGSLVNFEGLKKDPALSQTEILTPDTPGYKESIVRWSDTCEKEAGAVVKITTAEEVSAVIKFATANKIPLTVHSSGHSTSGSSSIGSDGIVIDLTKLRAVTIDPEAKTITAGGGARWEDVDKAAAKHGLATVGGTVNHTGIAGLTLGGGYGWLTGRHGLTIDVLRSVKVVLADGSIVTASEKENADLFWAIRGAGQQFGVVTEFMYQGFEQSNPVWAGLLGFPPEKLPQIVEFANKFHETSNGDQGMNWGFSAPPPVCQTIVMTAVFYNGSQDEAEKFFADLLALGPILNHTHSMPYEEVNGMLNAATTYGGRKMFGGGHFTMPLTTPFAENVFATFNDFVKSNENVNESMILFEMLPHSKVLQVPQEATSFANRGHFYNAATLTRWYNAEQDEVCKGFSKSLSKLIRDQGGLEEAKLGTKAEGVGIYANYLGSSEVKSRDVFGVNTPRLQQLKKKYDPGNVFRKFHNLLPAEEA